MLYIPSLISHPSFHTPSPKAITKHTPWHFRSIVMLVQLHLSRDVIPPNLLRNLHLKPNLLPLLVLAQLVPFHRTTEPTLVTDAQLIQSALAVLARLCQSLHHGVLVVQVTLLTGHDAQHHDLVLRQVSEGTEVAAPGIVVLQKVHVDVEILEQNFRDWLVPSLSEPLAPVVASAQVNTNGHVARSLLDGLVDQVGVLAGELFPVAPVAGLGLGPHLRVAQVGEVGVVELDEPATRVVQVLEFLLVHAGQVVEEVVQGRVGVEVDGVPPAAKVHHGRAGDGHLGGDLPERRLAPRRGDLALEELEIVHLDGLAVAQLARHHEPGRHPPALGLVRRQQTALDLDAVQVLEEIEVEKGTSKLAVGDGPETRLELFAHDL